MNIFSLMGNGLDNLFGAYNMGHRPNDELYSLIICNIIEMLDFLYTKVRYAIGFDKEYSSSSSSLILGCRLVWHDFFTESCSTV